MNQKTKTLGGNMGVLLWGAAVSVLAIGIYANYEFSQVSLILRVLGMLLAFGVALGLASMTKQGKTFWQFAKEARIEIRKVVWPSRQETVQTTGIVLAMVIIVGLILWGLDALLLRVIGWLGGYGA